LPKQYAICVASLSLQGVYVYATTNNMAIGGKCTVLSLKREIKLIEVVESGKKPKNAVIDFGLSLNAVSVILK